jgi:serine/threonine protein kinase
MRPDASPPPDGWLAVEDSGRSFLRTTLPGIDPGLPRPGFVVARLLAERYQVDEVFAVSESSVLLGAVDRRLGRRVLIKALRYDAIPVAVGHPDVAALFAEEVRRLRHQLQTERRLLVRLRNAGCNAVPHPDAYVYDRNPLLGDEADPGRPPLEEAQIATEPYLVLPRLAGSSLEAVLAQRYPDGMEEGDTLRLIAPIVGALAVLHEPWRLESGRTWHCVYQDLKPSNILIDPAGRPTLLDFGGCQVVVDGVPVLEGACTPGYSAPECAEPGHVLLPCADVWSVGAVLHQMLSGVGPDERRPLRRGGPPRSPDPRDLPPRVSAPMREILGRCLAERPSGRIADARQLARALMPLVEAAELGTAP